MESQPVSCIEENPTSQSVYLDGICINLTALSKMTGIDQGYLSRTLSGKHSPNLFYAERIAISIGISLDRLAKALREVMDNKTKSKARIPGPAQSTLIS